MRLPWQISLRLQARYGADPHKRSGPVSVAHDKEGIEVAVLPGKKRYLSMSPWAWTGLLLEPARARRQIAFCWRELDHVIEGSTFQLPTVGPIRMTGSLQIGIEAATLRLAPFPATPESLISWSKFC